MNLSKRIAALAVLAALFMFVAGPALAEETKPVTPVEEAPTPVNGLLDGKTFDCLIKVSATPSDPKAKPMGETLIFSNNALFSLIFKAQGFGEGAYTAKQDGNTIYFQSRLNKIEDPSMALQWDGKVVNSKTTNSQTLTATAKLFSAGKALSEYTVTGNLKLMDLPVGQ